MSPFDNNVSNRMFAAFLSILLMTPTGCGLYTFWTHDPATDKKDWVIRIFVHAGMDVVAIALVYLSLGCCGPRSRPSGLTGCLVWLQNISLSLLEYSCVSSLQCSPLLL